MANVSQNTGPGPVGEDLDQYSELDWMRWRSNRWTVAEWTEWWDSLSSSDQSYFGKLQMAFPEYFKATDVSEQSYQEKLQRHRQEHSQEQAEALSDFHARQRSRSPLAAATAKAVPKAVSSSIPAAQRLQMGQLEL